MSTFRIPANRKQMDPALAALGLSALACTTCNQHLTSVEEGDILTSYWVDASCGHSVEAESAVLKIKPDYAPLLSARGLRKEKWWYHATNIIDWKDTILKPTSEIMVHIGSKESAEDRARYAGGRFMNVMRLKPDAKLSPYVVDDMNHWPENVAETRDVEWSNFSQITRYVNRYEVPGSISLLVAASAVDVVDTYRLR